MAKIRALLSRPHLLLLFVLYLGLSVGYVAFTTLAGTTGIETADAIVNGTLEIRSVYKGFPADRAGLLPGDKILAYNDFPVTEVFKHITEEDAELTGKSVRYLRILHAKTVTSHAFGTFEPTKYTIQRDNSIMTVMVEYMPVGFREISWAVIARFFSGLVLVGLALYVYIQRPGIKTARIFLVFSCLIALYNNIGVFSQYWEHHVVLFFNIAGPLTEFLCYMLFFHFTLYYPQREKAPQLLLIALYTVGTVFVAAYIYSYMYLSIDPTYPYWLRKTYKYILSVLGVGVLAYRYLKPETPADRYKYQWILIGVLFWLLSDLALSLSALIEWGDFSYYSEVDQLYKSIAFLAIPLAFLFTVVRYRLFDINTLITKTITYGILTGVLFLIYFGIVQLFHIWLQNTTYEIDETWAGFILVILAVFVMNPLRSRLQNFIDQAFYRDSLDDYATLRMLSENLYAETRDEKILRHISEQLVNLLKLRTVAAYTINSRTGRFELAQFMVHPDPDSPPVGKEMFVDIPPKSGLINNLKIDELGFYIDETSLSVINLTSAEVELLRSFDSEFIIGLRSGGRLLGFLVLGRKVNLQPLFVREIDIVRTVGRGTALAIENAMLYQETQQRERIEREVMLAQSVQRTLLPNKIPPIPGAELSAFSQAAREIGGDFYEFFRSDLGHWEFALGDVSGKGVSAGMVAAITAGICMARERSEADSGRILTQINSVLIETHITNHNVALIYATYNPETGRVSISNAGIPYPILIRNGKASYIKIGGLPLGSLADYIYRSQHFVLKPGDRLVLYSDGITETTGVDGELLGFERLLEHVQGLANGSADEIRDGILNLQRRFAKISDDLEDDCTILVLHGRAD